MPKRKRLFTSKPKKRIKESSDEEEEEQGNRYEIEKIENHRIGKKNVEFLVKWKGYGKDSNTWENFEMFAYDAPEVAERYLKKALGE